jgi:hypothetical protein
VRHQGGGLFALATARLYDAVARAEQAVVERVEALQAETRAALERHLRRLDLAALERLARLFIERGGARGVERVKRVDATAYLAASLRRGALRKSVLVAVRAGGDEAGRRAVGELRAGVVTKQLHEGWLLTAGHLSAEAERELAAPGPPLHVLDGPTWAAALVDAGVGVIRNNVPVVYLDVDLLAELAEGK